MNLSWEIFKVSENALGGVTSNVFRGATIAVAIVATIIYKKRKGMKLVVNKQTLWWKSLPPIEKVALFAEDDGIQLSARLFGSTLYYPTWFSANH